MQRTGNFGSCGPREAAAVVAAVLLALATAPAAAKDRTFDKAFEYRIGWPERLPSFVSLEADGWVPSLSVSLAHSTPKGDLAWFAPSPMGALASGWASFAAQDRQGVASSPRTATASPAAVTPEAPTVTASVRPGGAVAEARDELLARGRASWYDLRGLTTSGETYRPGELTAAHHSLPFGTRIRVVNQENGQSVVVRINDRIPARSAPVINLSRAAAKALGIAGTAPVALYLVDRPPTPATDARVSQSSR